MITAEIILTTDNLTVQVLTGETMTVEVSLGSGMLGGAASINDEDVSLETSYSSQKIENDFATRTAFVSHINDASAHLLVGEKAAYAGKTNTYYRTTDTLMNSIIGMQVGDRCYVLGIEYNYNGTSWVLPGDTQYSNALFPELTTLKKAIDYILLLMSNISITADNTNITADNTNLTADHT